nr:MAG TPA: hypothetical protein [Caudoviricetes sp.]
MISILPAPTKDSPLTVFMLVPLTSVFCFYESSAYI